MYPSPYVLHLHMYIKYNLDNLHVGIQMVLKLVILLFNLVLFLLLKNEFD